MCVCSSLSVLIKAPTEVGRSVREAQQRRRHQFCGEQFVVGEKVQETPAFLFPLEAMNSGEVRFAGTLRFETQFGRPTGRGGREQRRAGRIVGDFSGHLEFFLQRRGEQDSLGEITKFHCLEFIR